MSRFAITVSDILIQGYFIDIHKYIIQVRYRYTYINIFDRDLRFNSQQYSANSTLSCIQVMSCWHSCPGSSMV